MSDSKSPVWDSILLLDVLAIIATYLELRDLKSFRLVNSHFCAVADPLLFESITVGHQQMVLETFTNICNHDYFRRQVKKLRYNTTVIQEMTFDK